MPLFYNPRPPRSPFSVAIDYSSQLVALQNIGSNILGEAIKFNARQEKDYTPELEEISESLGVINKSVQHSIDHATQVGKEAIAAMHAGLVGVIDKLDGFESSNLSALKILGENLGSVITAESNQVEDLLAQIKRQNDPIQLACSSLSLLAGEGGLSIEVVGGMSSIDLVLYDSLPFSVNSTEYNSDTQYSLKVGRGMQLPVHNIEINAGTRFSLLVCYDSRLKLAEPLVVGSSLPFTPDQSVDQQNLPIDSFIDDISEQIKAVL